jgi:hypothetical protein
VADSLDISEIVMFCGKRRQQNSFYAKIMSFILAHIEENPKETQRLIGLEYPELQQLTLFHNSRQPKI